MGVAVESVWVEAEAEAEAGANVEQCARGSEAYREIDRQLRSIAKRKAGLEIEEARWLREAERQRIWRKLGFSTALEYLEDVFGYSPRTAMDRLRVANELASLPALEAAVGDGELPYSAARELTRVMTRETEQAWLASARGKNLRDIEELVAGRKKGDNPDAPKHPDLSKRRRVFELSPRVDVMFEQCRSVLADELGNHVDDEAMVEALCLMFLRGDRGVCENTISGDENAGENAAGVRRIRAPRPAYRIVVSKCDECSRAWQQGRGRMIELTASELALAECDGETVRSSEETVRLDDETDQASDAAVRASDATLREAPERATPNIPQRIRNRVWARDQGRCRVPGCRATRNLDLHHIIHRSDGGDHDPANLLVTCSGHHKLHHNGLLTITGRAPNKLTFVRDGKVLVDARSLRARKKSHALRKHTANSKFAEVTTREHAKQALVNLGFKARVASELLGEVRAHVGSDADVSTLVKASLARSGTSQAAEDDDLPDLACKALVQLGFSSAIATRAVEAANAHVGTATELGALIKEALRWC